LRAARSIDSFARFQRIARDVKAAAAAAAAAAAGRQEYRAKTRREKLRTFFVIGLLYAGSCAARKIYCFHARCG